MKHVLFLCFGLLLTACDPSMDLHGHDPNKYYAEHPKVNKLQTLSISRNVHFERGADVLEPGERNNLYAVLRDATPESTDSIVVQLSPGQVNNQKRRTSLRKTLRSFGYTQNMLAFEPAQSLDTDEAQIVLNYTSVVLPDCPDWRMSPVTTYSNTSQGNFGCATVVNLGLMVVDPHDLVRGSGTSGMDTQRNTQVMSDYRSGRIKASVSNDSAESAASAPTSSAGSTGQ